MARLFPNNHYVPPQFPEPGKDLVRLVIAEAPGQEEHDQGVPLVGGSGRIFNKLLSRVGIDRDGLTIINCINCQPPNNVFPTDPAAKQYISKSEANQAVSHCNRVHVRPLLDSRNWRRIDLLGDKPLRIIANKDGGVFKWRGSPLVISGTNRSFRGLATLHPAYLMRDQEMLPVAANDLIKSLDEPPEYYNPFPSLEDVQRFVSTRFAFDIECTRYKALGETAPADLVGFTDEANHAICVPIRGAYVSEVKRIFANAKEVIGFNCLQFDLPKLRDAGIKIRPECVVHDVMLQQHLLFPSLPHDLEFVGSQFVSKPAWKDDKSEGWERYNCRDTDVTFQCWQQIFPMLKAEKLDELYFNVQVPLAKICLLLHETGFKLDPNQIKRVRAKLLAQCREEESRLPDFLRTRTEKVNGRVKAPPGTLGKSGKPVRFCLVPRDETVIPWRSTAAKARYLYGHELGCLGFEPVLDPKSGRITTGKIALDKIYGRTKNPAVRAIRILNQLDELITTFAKEDMVKIDRMFPHLNVHGTASGRLSSSDPNLQNIPESTRYIYVPSHAGWKIVDVDYSQIENRLTAYFAGDSERLERFRRDPKFSEHKYAASLFLGINYEDVVKDNAKDAPYGKAKRIVHGTNYGMGYMKIANTFDMEPRETKRLQDIWKAAIRKTIQWQNKCGEIAKTQGYLETPFGRKRWFWTSSYYTEALSFLPQSTAADIIFRAMIGIMYERIGLSESSAKLVCPYTESLQRPARLLLQVHDSLIFECPAEMVDDLISVVTRVMTQPWSELGGMSIPIGVKTGDSWGDCE